MTLMHDAYERVRQRQRCDSGGDSQDHKMVPSGLQGVTLPGRSQWHTPSNLAQQHSQMGPSQSRPISSSGSHGVLPFGAGQMCSPQSFLPSDGVMGGMLHSALVSGGIPLGTGGIPLGAGLLLGLKGRDGGRDGGYGGESRRKGPASASCFS